MKIKSAVFLVESPMQLINAIEAKHYFSISETFLLIRYDGIKSNDNHIDYVLNTIDNQFSRISYIMLRYGKKSILKMLVPIVWCIRYNPEYLFIGNYFSGFSRIARLLYPNRKTIYLDDGAQTTKLYYDNKKINLFSYFSFDELFAGRIYKHHNFEYLKHRLRGKSQNVIKGTIFFIGTPLVENNLIEASQYDKLLKSLLIHYKDYNIRYFPHRFEDLRKLRSIEGLNIETINMPFELYILQCNTLPEKIVSFYSAALYTINSMVGDVSEVEAFRIPESYFIDIHYADKISKLYDYLSQTLTVIYDDKNL